MQVHFIMNHLDVIGKLISWQKDAVRKSDCTNVFHGCNTELRTVNDVVLIKWEGTIEHFGIEVYPLRQNSEYKVCIDKICLSFADKDTHGRWRIISRVGDHSEITCAEVVNI